MLAVEVVQVRDQAASAAVLPADPSAVVAQVAAVSAAIRVAAARVVALQGAWAVHHDHPLVPRVPLAGLLSVDRVEHVHQQVVLPRRVPKTRIDAGGGPCFIASGKALRIEVWVPAGLWYASSQTRVRNWRSDPLLRHVRGRAGLH